MADPRYIISPAMRLARLAALERCPPFILLDQADTLVRRIEALMREQGEAPDEYRQRRAAIQAEADQLSLSPEEIAEFEREEAEFNEADAKARKAAGYSEQEWGRLDSNYRFGLIMDQHPDDDPAPHLSPRAGGGVMLTYPYLYRWDRQGRKGQRCRVFARGTMNSVGLEFEDGYRMVSSGNALRKAPAISPATEER